MKTNIPPPNAYTKQEITEAKGAMDIDSTEVSVPQVTGQSPPTKKQNISLDDFAIPTENQMEQAFQDNMARYNALRSIDPPVPDTPVDITNTTEAGFGQLSQGMQQG